MLVLSSSDSYAAVIIDGQYLVVTSGLRPGFSQCWVFPNIIIPTEDSIHSRIRFFFHWVPPSFVQLYIVTYSIACILLLVKILTEICRAIIYNVYKKGKDTIYEQCSTCPLGLCRYTVIGMSLVCQGHLHRLMRGNRWWNAVIGRFLVKSRTLAPSDANKPSWMYCASIIPRG